MVVYFAGAIQPRPSILFGSLIVMSTDHLEHPGRTVRTQSRLRSERQAAASPVAKPSTAADTAQEPPQEEDAAENKKRIFFSSLRGASSCLVSAVVHMILLIALALLTFANLPKEEKHLLVVTDPEVDEQPLQELTEIQIDSLTELEEPEVMTEMLPVAALDAGQIAFGDFSTAVDPATNESIDLAVDTSTMDEIGSLLGKNGAGMTDIGEGLQAAATFFGQKSRGKKFVFVVDNSNSMGGGRFETALIELVNTVEKLGPQQEFYVVFFSDTAYPLFYPDSESKLVPATPKNKERFKRWLSTVEMCLRTKGELAIKTALSLNPDAIYILGDGVFTDRTGDILTAPHTRRIAIHTVGMEVEAKGEQELRAIAAANNGTYRLAAPNPIAQQMARKSPIKKNNVKGSVWGITLPTTAPKKK